MENEGVAYEATWGSFEESEMMAQLLGGAVASNYFPSDQEQELTNAMHLMFWPNHDSDSNFSSPTDVNYNSYYWPQSIPTPCISTSTSSFLLSNPSYGGGCYLGDSNLVPHNTTSSFDVDFNSRYGDIPSMNEEACDDNELGLSIANQMRPVFADKPLHAAKRKFGLGDNEKPIEDVKDDDTSSLVPRKKARVTVAAQKRNKNADTKKPQKNEENGSADFHGQSSSSCSSEDDSSGSQEQTEGGGNTSSRSKKSATTSITGKTRAERGSATDPQSLYARKRRERINERLRILQNLPYWQYLVDETQKLRSEELTNSIVSPLSDVRRTLWAHTFPHHITIMHSTLLIISFS